MMGLQERFETYHSDNPHIYDMFCEFTFRAIRHGCKHLGAKLVFERIRWQTSVETDGDEFKINNNYSAFYARKFMDEFPEHDGFFRLRHSAADAA